MGYLALSLCEFLRLLHGYENVSAGVAPFGAFAVRKCPRVLLLVHGIETGRHLNLLLVLSQVALCALQDLSRMLDALFAMAAVTVALPVSLWRSGSGRGQQ